MARKRAKSLNYDEGVKVLEESYARRIRGESIEDACKSVGKTPGSMFNLLARLKQQGYVPPVRFYKGNHISKINNKEWYENVLSGGSSTPLIFDKAQPIERTTKIIRRRAWEADKMYLLIGSPDQIKTIIKEL